MCYAPTLLRAVEDDTVCRCRSVHELSLTVMYLIGKGELFSKGLCAQIPKLIWAILFGNLTMVIGWGEQFFFQQLV